jgi:hypothetical protein
MPLIYVQLINWNLLKMFIYLFSCHSGYQFHCWCRPSRQVHNNFSNQINEHGEDEHFNQVPKFSNGLCHMLSGIMAHLSSTVISATMAWHLAV